MAPMVPTRTFRSDWPPAGVSLAPGAAAAPTVGPLAPPAGVVPIAGAAAGWLEPTGCAGPAHAASQRARTRVPELKPLARRMLLTPSAPALNVLLASTS